VKRRNIFAIIAAGVLGILVFWVCLPASVGNTDAARYQRWQHTERLYRKAVWWRNQLPQGLARLFHVSALPQKYIKEREKLTETLVASGYLTNVTVAAAPTNSTQFTATIARIRKACQGRDEWNISLLRNGVVITCRPQDEFQCRQAIQE
jgi:hypothetical protein